MDYKSVAEDLDSVLDNDADQGSAYVILILPTGRPRYLSDMLTRIQGHSRAEKLAVRKHNVPFEEGATEGIVLVWIERKAQSKLHGV